MDISYKQTLIQKISKNNKKHKGQFIDVVGFTLLRAHLKKTNKSIFILSQNDFHYPFL